MCITIIQYYHIMTLCMCLSSMEQMYRSIVLGIGTCTIITPTTSLDVRVWLRKTNLCIIANDNELKVNLGPALVI